jgi:hypothetical protein
MRNNDSRSSERLKMPRRTNIFQRLVAAIHTELAPAWTVEESKLLRDVRTGDDREVDIVASAGLCGYRLIMSIEVRDRRRRADVTWVEEMAQKHADLPTSKLILWSPSGFTKSALSKANSLNVETVAPGGIERAPWASFARNLIGGSLKYVRPSFAPVVDVRLQDGSVTRWDAPVGMLLVADDESTSVAVGAILQQMHDNPDLRTVMLDHAPEGAGDFHAIYNPPVPCTVRGPSGDYGKVERLVIGIKTVCEVSPVVARTAVRDQTATTLIEASLTDGTLQLVVREPLHGPPQVRSKLVKHPPVPHNETVQLTGSQFRGPATGEMSP